MSKSSGSRSWKNSLILLVKVIVTFACGIATLFIPLSLKDEGMVWYQSGQGPNAQEWVLGQGATPNTTCHLVLLLGVPLVVGIILFLIIKQPEDD